VRTGRSRAGLGDRRLLGLLVVTVAASLALTLTPLASRAGILLGWGVLVYLVAALLLPTGGTTEAIAAPAVGQPEAVEAAPAPAAAPAGGTALIRATEEALKKLNNPAALGECALASRLPCTLRALGERGGGEAPPSRHQALRALLVEAIDRLRPPAGVGPGESAPYHLILHEEYVLGHSTARIMARYSISESTLHRYRRDAIRAVAQDLTAQEEALARARA
jgi:hypothetical protein